MQSFEGLVERVPGVQGGEAVVAGTRTPVRSVVEYDRIYHGDVGAILRALPHLTRLQVEAALAYYSTHRSEIDDEIRLQHEAFQRSAGV